MNNLQVVNKTEILGQEIQVYGDFDNPLFLARDVANWIEHSKPNELISNVDEEEKMKRTIFHGGQNRSMWFLTERGIYQVLANSRKYKALNLLQYMENEYTYKKTPKEATFLHELELALKPFNIQGIDQYNVLNYRIDYYIPSLNIAIEYDEKGHKNYSYEKQELRQSKIEDELNCKFIRVTDEYSNIYNIGLIIKHIFNIGEVA